MYMTTVLTMKFVTKAVVSMLAELQIVEVTQNVKLVSIQQLVNVCPVLRVTPKLHVPSVSTVSKNKKCTILMLEN